MSFLGSLFDPVGALATDGHNNTFDSVFSPGDNLFGDQGLGFEPSWSQNFNNSYAEPAGNFADNVMDINRDEARHLGSHFLDNPSQLVTGVDPISTKFWNAATNQNNTPWVNQYGGETNADYNKSDAKGYNSEDGRTVGAIANMIAGYYGGQSLGGLVGNAYGGATAGAGAEGSAGSSALDVQAELAAGSSASAGTGSSAAGYDATQIPGWVAGSGAGGANAGHAVSNTTAGASQGFANAENSGQNPWKAALEGGIRSGVGSNLDYSGSVGINDPLYKAGINGAINGGVRAGMADTSNTGYGALVGSLQGLAGQAGSAVGNYFSATPSDTGGAGNGGTTNWGNLATGLGNYVMARHNDQGIQSQINSLKDLYSPNSAYAQQMAQTLQRQDAASGRGSQYGTRAVELQARLADAATRNAPTLANLYAQQRSNRFNQYAGLLATGRNAGLGNMFQQQPTPVMQNNFAPIQASPSDFTQYDPNDTRNNVMATVPGSY